PASERALLHLRPLATALPFQPRNPRRSLGTFATSQTRSAARNRASSGPSRRSTSAAFAELAAEGHARAHGASDQAALGVGHVALRETDGPSAFHHPSGGDEAAVPERPQEV